MIRVVLFLFFLISFSCSKEEEECVIILNKETIKGDNYFYFRPNYFPSSQSNNIGGTGLNRDYASGKVSQEIYDQYAVGDEYCF